MSTTSMEAFYLVEQIRKEIKNLERLPKSVKESRKIEFTQQALKAEDRLEEHRSRIEKNFSRNQTDDSGYLLETIKEVLGEIAFFVKSLLCPTEPNHTTD